MYMGAFGMPVPAANPLQNAMSVPLIYPVPVGMALPAIHLVQIR